jgi:DNA modification methylase/predicted RNA-binding Zn-ribbon protein involved in translation (DUF1610 family)
MNMAEKMPDNLKDLDNLKPIDHAVIARPHTPVYKMHRYFARRPWSVFRSLIEHYSNPGSIILDPFCGGGVTVVEGLRLGRKVIGVDINPMATFITAMEIVDADVDDLRTTFDQIRDIVSKDILDQYQTVCHSCNGKAIADYYEYSNQYECPTCNKTVQISKCVRIRQGEYECHQCSKPFRTTHAKRLDDLMIRVRYTCPICDQTLDKEPDAADLSLKAKAEEKLSKFGNGFWIPDKVMPDDYDMRRPYNAMYKRFTDFFTPRNLLCLSILLNAIRELPNGTTKDLLLLTFSSTLDWCSRITRVVDGAAREITTATYWVPTQPAENNVWLSFLRRFKATQKGKIYSNREIKAGAARASSYSDLLDDKFYLIHTGSSSSLPMPNESVDAIVTDPPYGANVMYAELSNFWAVWLGDKLGLESGLIDDAEEAIQNKRQSKTIAHYRKLLFLIFKECHRVLKPNRWMVMTFHNREFKVWNAIHLAAHDAGFVLAEHDGMIYQPPIQAYTTTLYQRRSGSMLGDFILSFQKVDKQPDFKQIEHAEIGRQIERLAAEAVLHHKGASLSLIYMKLMPWLLNNNLLDKISEKELVPYLTNNFEEKDSKWRLKASPGDELKQALEEYSRQHYKSSYEDLDFVPVEARIEYLIRRLLYSRGFATQDDILNTIYENLINSNMAEAREIQQVLGSIATLMPISQAAAGKVSKGKAGRKVWKLKEDIEREKLFAELGADVEYRLATSEESDHDLAIARLVEMAGLRNLKAHIGKTEQVKYTEFRKMTSDLPAKVVGMPKAARNIIEQIDVLWHNGGKGIVAAFEVERTTTITSGIDRFRNLLTVAAGTEIELYLVVPKSRGNEVRSKLGSPANRKDGLHKKIGYIYLEDLDIRHAVAAVDFEKIKHFINGGQQ